MLSRKFKLELCPRSALFMLSKSSIVIFWLWISGFTYASVQEICCQIMPAARAFPLVKLIDTLQDYEENTQQKIFIEYIMFDGVTDEDQHAHLLGKNSGNC